MTHHMVAAPYLIPLSEGEMRTCLVLCCSNCSPDPADSTLLAPSCTFEHMASVVQHAVPIEAAEASIPAF